MRYLSLLLSLLLLAALACNMPSAVDLSGPTPPPLPTLQLGDGNGDAPTEAAPPTEAPSETPEPTATEAVTPTETATLEATPTQFVTPTRLAATATTQGGGQMVVRDVAFVTARRIAGTDNDADAVLRIDFNGGRAPFSLFGNENQPLGSPQPEGTVVVEGVTWQFVTFTERTSCGANLVKAVTIQSADGQSNRISYFVTVVCPP